MVRSCFVSNIAMLRVSPMDSECDGWTFDTLDGTDASLADLRMYQKSPGPPSSPMEYHTLFDSKGFVFNTRRSRYKSSDTLQIDAVPHCVLPPKDKTNSGSSSADHHIVADLHFPISLFPDLALLHCIEEDPGVIERELAPPRGRFLRTATCLHTRLLDLDSETNCLIYEGILLRHGFQKMDEADIVDILLRSEISDIQAFDSDEGGDSDAEDILPVSVLSRVDQLSHGSSTNENQLNADPILCMPSTSRRSGTIQLSLSDTAIGSDDERNIFSDDTDDDPTFIPVQCHQKKHIFKRKSKVSLLYYKISSEDSDCDKLTTQTQKRKKVIKPTTKTLQVNQHNTKIQTKKTLSKQKNKTEHKLNWTKVPNDPQKFINYQYNKEFGPLVDINFNDPLLIFKKIIDDDICNKIIQESNEFAKQNKTELNINKDELYAFIGIIIFMGFHSLPSMRLYWSEDGNFHVSRISRIMPLKRFLKILRYIHVNDNTNVPPRDSPDFDKLYKVRPLLDHLSNKYLNLFSPSRNLAIDESMVGFKGRTTLKQYMPKKPIKRGFKIWVIACS